MDDGLLIFSEQYFLLASLLSVSFVAFLLYLYSGAPIFWACEKVVHTNSQCRSKKVYKNPSKSIYLPWTLARGYLNIRKINLDHWLEIDDDYMCVLEEVEKSYAKPHTFLIQPGKECLVFEAGMELLDTIVKFFESQNPGMITKEGCMIRNTLTGKEWKVMSATNEKMGGEKNGSVASHPLLVARNLVAEDLLIMAKDEGVHVLSGGVLAFPDNWKLEEKMGLPLAAIHYPVKAINVAQETVATHTLPSSSPVVRTMETFFNNMHKPENITDVHTRASWAFQHHSGLNNRFETMMSHVADKLRTAMTYLVRGDEVKELRVRSTIRQFFVQAFNFIRCNLFNLPPLELYLRTERQSLRLLPKSKCVVFAIRTRVDPIRKAIDTPEKAADLRRALLEDVAKTDNSGKGKYRDEVLNWLKKHYGKSVPDASKLGLKQT